MDLPRTASDPYPMLRRVLLRLAVCDQQAELGAVPEGISSYSGFELRMSIYHVMSASLPVIRVQCVD